MPTFWSLLRESTILQGIISLALIGATIYMYVTTGEAPESLVSGMMLVLGFFFGGKVQGAIDRGGKE